MPSPRKHKVKLSEAIKTVRNGFFDKRITFGDDEYIILQSPWSRPSEYLLERQKELDEVRKLEDDDPKKIKYFEDDAMDRLFHVVVDWNMTRAEPDGKITKLQTPSRSDQSGWDALNDDERLFIDYLIGEMWYDDAGERKTPEAELSVEPDPNSVASTPVNVSAVQ